ncbi:MAG: hypothetical protein IJX49_01220 [Clostridia bacterium]|nr:hypothetical protein [Clostridia bacterium]
MFNQNDKIVVMQNPSYLGGNMWFTTEENYKKRGTKEYNRYKQMAIPWDESIKTFDLVVSFLNKTYGFKPENIINLTRL